MKSLKLSFLLALAALCLLAVSSHATLRTWNGGSGTTANWNDAANWVGGTAPATNNVDGLFFSGSTRQNNTNNFGITTNTSLSFASGGWTLNGNPVTMGGPFTNTTGTNVINNNIVLTATRTAYFGAGQLTINGNVSGAFGLATGGGVGGTLVLGGSNSFTGGTTINSGSADVVITTSNALGTGSVSIPHAGTAIGALKLQLTGSNTIANTFSGFSSANTGVSAIPQIENVSGTNTLTSPLIVTSTGGNGLVIQSDAGALLILNGTMGSSQSNRQVQVMGSGNGIINGAITNGQNGTGSFPVGKWGSGTWTLNGTNITTGGVTINQGKLALGATGSFTNSPSVAVASGAVFDVSAVTGGWLLLSGQSLQGNGGVVGNVTTTNGANISPGTVGTVNTTAGTLTYSNNLTLNGNTSLRMNLSSDPTGLIKPSDLIVVAGNFTALGTNNVALQTYLNGSIANGTYHIVKFNGNLTGDATNFSVSGFVAGGRGIQGGYVVTNTGYIDLVVTGAVPANLVWRGDGAANNWDIQTTSNWLNGASQDTFYNSDSVAFDDTATNFNVSVPATVTPGSVVVNSTNNYTISGSDITGSTGLFKTNSGTLTLSANNTFTGTTTYGGGSIATATIGNNATASPIGQGAQVLNGGALEYTGGGETTSRAFSIGAGGGTVAVDTAGVTLTGGTSGQWTSSGNTFTKTGPGTLAFAFQQTLTGTNNINGGILKIPTVSLFGTDLTTPVFINGGELDINGQTMSTKPVKIAGMGDATLNANSGTTNGAIINTGASQIQGLQFVTLTGDAAFGGTARWDIRANPTATLSTGGNAYNLVKGGANQVSLVGVTVDVALANIEVQAGMLSYQLATTGLGNPASTLTVRSGATFDLFAATIALNKQIVLADNSTLSASSGSSTIVGPVSLPGDLGGGPTFSASSGVTLNLNGVVSGPGTVTKTGNGTIVFAATNTYAGTTTINAGALKINSAMTNTSDITVADGATLGVIAAGTNQLSPTTLNMGGGAGAATNEFAGLASTTVAPLNPATLNLNDSVTINVASGTFTAGQTYPLITYGSIGGAGAYTLGTLPVGVSAMLVTNGSTIGLSVSSVVFNDVWTAAVNTNWDIATAANWIVNGSVGTFANGNILQFDDTSSNANVFVTTTVSPGNMTVNNTLKNYVISGSPINGSGSLTKQGSGPLTLSGANGFSGGTTLSAGTLNINNGTAVGSGTLTIGGGTIDNTSAGAVALANNNAQNWNGNFTFAGTQNLDLGAGAVTMSGSRSLAVNGSTLTVGGAINDSGSNYSLTKSGAGTLTLSSGANTYGGKTAITAGTLKATASGALPPTTAVNFNAASAAMLDLAGTAQSITNMIFTNIGTSTITITGTNGSALATAPTSLILSPLATTNTLVLNMAGLGFFAYTNAAGTFTVNNGLTGASSSSGQTTVTLAGGTNLIVAGTLNVGNRSPSSGVINSTMNLGTNNTLEVGSLVIGNGRAGGVVQFAAGLANSTLAISGNSGPGSVATLTFGNHDSFQAADSPVDMLDTTAGTLSAQFGGITIGVSAPTANMTANRGISSTSSFKMGAGTLTAASLTLGVINSATGDDGSFVYTITNTSLFSITNGGTATITNLTLAINNYPGNLSSDSKLTSTISLTNGATLNAASIVEGNIATPTAGGLNVISQIAFGDGTLANIAGGDLTVSNVNVVLNGSATTHNISISSGQNGVINSVVSGAGALTKTGNGTLWLNDAETYTGNTTINLGTLALTNTASLVSTNIVIAGSATFDVSGLTTLPLVLAALQSIGNSSSTAFVNGGVDASSGKLGMAYASGTPAISVKNGALTLGSGTTVTVNNTGASLGNGSFKIVSAGTGGSVAGTAPSTVSVGGSGMGSGGTASLAITGSELYLNVSGVSTVNTNSTVLTNTISGNTLTLSWPLDHQGWRLEVQTNTLSTGLGNNWFTWPNSTNLTTVPITLDPTAPTVFFRLVYP